MGGNREQQGCNDLILCLTPFTKQPLAYPYEDLKSDTDQAVQHVRGIVPLGPSLGHVVAVSWILDHPWLIGDLHKGNIMRDSRNTPTIIDALTGTIPTQAPKEITGLTLAIQDARDYRKTGHPPLRKPFEDVDDDVL